MIYSFRRVRGDSVPACFDQGGDITALFNNKEFETLQAENQRLLADIERLRSELKISQDREAFYKSTIMTYEQATENFRQRLLSQEQEITEKDAEIAELTRQLATVSARPHNERGAGRKYRATPEQRALILSLKNDGLGYGSIASILSERYGTAWNKTTIRNTVLAEKN